MEVHSPFVLLAVIDKTEETFGSKMEVSLQFSDQKDGQEIFKVVNVNNDDDLPLDYTNVKSVELSGKSAETLLKLLETDSFFKTAFLRHHKGISCVHIVITEPLKQEVDFKSCDIVSRKLWEQIEMEDALHWLSTLGGAYSNLGENSFNFVSCLGKLKVKTLLIRYCHFRLKRQAKMRCFK